jgi:hypothetical protein
MRRFDMLDQQFYECKPCENLSFEILHSIFTKTSIKIFGQIKMIFFGIMNSFYTAWDQRDNAFAISSLKKGFISNF